MESLLAQVAQGADFFGLPYDIVKIIAAKSPECLRGIISRKKFNYVGAVCFISRCGGEIIAVIGREGGKSDFIGRGGNVVYSFNGLIEFADFWGEEVAFTHRDKCYLLTGGRELRVVGEVENIHIAVLWNGGVYFTDKDRNTYLAGSGRVGQNPYLLDSEHIEFIKTRDNCFILSKADGVTVIESLYSKETKCSWSYGDDSIRADCCLPGVNIGYIRGALMYYDLDEGKVIEAEVVEQHELAVKNAARNMNIVKLNEILTVGGKIKLEVSKYVDCIGVDRRGEFIGAVDYNSVEFVWFSSYLGGKYESARPKLTAATVKCVDGNVKVKVRAGVVEDAIKVFGPDCLVPIDKLGVTMAQIKCIEAYDEEMSNNSVLPLGVDLRSEWPRPVFGWEKKVFGSAGMAELAAFARAGNSLDAVEFTFAACQLIANGMAEWFDANRKKIAE